MAKNSRFLESLVHDIPMYPFSSTPDGRIVAELHRGRRENKDFQEQSLAIQERAVERLIDIHKGAMAVPASDFRSSEAARILGDVAYEMQNVYAAQERSAQGIEALGQATSEGFDQVHEDLREIKGPTYPHEDLGELVESDQDFFAAMCAYTKGMLNQRAISQFHGVFTQKMKGVQNATYKIEETLERKMQEEQLKQYKQFQKAQGIDPQKQENVEALLPPLKTLRDFPEIKEALLFLRNPLRLLAEQSENIYNKLALLLNTAEQYDVPLLKAVVEYVERFLELYRKAKHEPIPQEMLIKLGQNHLLIPAVQHRVMKAFPETRDDASLTTINYSLLDIARDTRTAIQQRNILAAIAVTSLSQQQGLYDQGEIAISQRNEALQRMSAMVEQNQTAIRQREISLGQGETAIKQRDIANYHLASIVENLTDMKDGMVDLGDIVEDFADMVEAGLEEVNGNLTYGFATNVGALKDIDVKLAVSNASLQGIAAGLGVIDWRLMGVEESLSLIDEDLCVISEQIETTNEWLQGIDSTLSNIQMQMVLTRTAVVAELKKIDMTILGTGQGIVANIGKTNALLSELVDLTRDAHKNEARQYFEEGIGCLRDAEEMDHIREAHERFCKGIQAHSLTIVNYYGAALCDELLGKLAEAKKRYGVVIARSNKEQTRLKSQAQEGTARVEYKLGNFHEAIKHSREAFETDQENYTAKYDHARYLIVSGFIDEGIAVLSALIIEKPEFYPQMKIDKAFKRISKREMTKLYQQIFSNGPLKIKLEIMEDVINFATNDFATDFIVYFIEKKCSELIGGVIWSLPGFRRLQKQLFVKIRNYLQQYLELLTAKSCYELTILLNYIGFDPKTIREVFEKGVRNDPVFYTGGAQKGEMIMRELEMIDPLSRGRLGWLLRKINL